jgi:hypothetical protein
MSDILIYEELLEILPPFFTRQVAVKHLGGLFNNRTLRDLDCKGLGPSSKTRIGRKVVYTRDNFITWLKNYGKK